MKPLWTLRLLIGLSLAIQKSDAQPTWWRKHASKFTCQRPGYFVNEADCHNFYRCVDRSTWDKPALQRYDFSCPNGMVFDPAVSVCTDPGPSGCAEPWWPDSSSGEGSNGRPPSGSIGGANKPGRPGQGGGGNSIETLPSIFDSSKGPGGRRPSGVSDSPWYQNPQSVPASPSGGNPFSPGGGSNNDELDPLDIDFGSDLDSGSKPSTPSSAGNLGGGSRPSSNSPGSSFGGGSGGDLELDPLDIDFGASPDSGNSAGVNKPSSPLTQGSSREPFGSNKGSPGNNDDPLDFEFGSPPGRATGFNRPSSTGSGPFGGGGNKDVDPLDIEFGADPDPISGNSGSTESPTASFGTPSKSCELLLGCDDDNKGGSQEGSKPSGKPNSPPATTNRPRPRPGVWDRNDFPESPSELDSWGSNELGQGNRPSSNWGGAQRPGSTSTPPPSSFDTSPWRPMGGPWGSGFNDLNSIPRPGSSSPSGNSWWDPPVALPLRPSTPRITPPDTSSSPRPVNPRIHAPHPPPPPWANPFRPRYPVYEIVAYPTWPGPMNRRPIIVVYSNSKK